MYKSPPQKRKSAAFSEGVLLGKKAKGGLSTDTGGESFNQKLLWHQIQEKTSFTLSRKNGKVLSENHGKREAKRT